MDDELIPQKVPSMCIQSESLYTMCMHACLYVCICAPQFHILEHVGMQDKTWRWPSPRKIEWILTYKENVSKPIPTSHYLVESARSLQTVYWTNWPDCTVRSSNTAMENPASAIFSHCQAIYLCEKSYISMSNRSTISASWPSKDDLPTFKTLIGLGVGGSKYMPVRCWENNAIESCRHAFIVIFVFV